MVADGLWPGDPTRFSETVILQRPGSTTFTMYPDADFPDLQIRSDPATLRVAIPASILKLNADFLATCQAIRAKARRPVEFHFFPSVRNLLLFRVKREIQKWIPDAVVHPQCDYNEYLRLLSGCDIHFSSFPFGGTNSNIDSLQLGLPMLALLGPEPHGQIDASMMRRAGLPEWLIANDPVAFEQAALRLIENDSERVTIAQQLVSTDVTSLFTRPDPKVPEGEFRHVMEFLYEHHESIQASGRRYWSPLDRDGFLATHGAAARNSRAH